MNKELTAEEKKRLQIILEATNDHDLARKLGVAQKTAKAKTSGTKSSPKGNCNIFWFAIIAFAVLYFFGKT